MSIYVNVKSACGRSSASVDKLQIFADTLGRVACA